MTDYYADTTEIDGQRALVFTPAVPDARPELRRALDLRRQATLTGHCPCEAIRSQPNRADRRAARRGTYPLYLTMHHADDCPATDENILRLRRAELL